MPQKKPSVVVVTAFVQVAFGVFGVFDALSTLLSAQGTVATLGGMQPNALLPFDGPRIIGYVGEHLPSLPAAVYALTGLYVALCALMVVGGVGLYRLRPWGWKATLAYVLLSLAIQLAWAAYLWCCFVPTFRGCGNLFWAEATEDGVRAALMLYFLAYGVAAVESAGILYPALILFVMTRRSFQAAFTQDAGEVPGAAAAAAPPPAAGEPAVFAPAPTDVAASPPKS
jgi:hypothetical protein